MRKNTISMLQQLLFVAIACGVTISFAQRVRADEQPKVKPQTKLMVMDADGKNMKEIFRSEVYTGFGSPAYSPDGKQIAMDAWKEGETFANAHIVVINADGTGLKDLGDGLMPSWSADGKQFAFSRRDENNGVWTMNVDGTNKKVLDLNGWSAQWSPDGKKILYSVYNRAGTSLKIFDIKKAESYYVVSGGSTPYQSFTWNMCWSPDSQSICFYAKTNKGYHEIVTASAEKESKDLEVHYSDPKVAPSADLSWHKDGELMLFILRSKAHDNKRKVFSFNPLNPEEDAQIVPGQKYDEAPGSVCWHPDGKQFVFSIR